MLFLPWYPLEVNHVVFFLWLSSGISNSPNNVLFVPTLPLGEREQNALTRCPPGFLRPLRSSLCHESVPKAAPGAARLPNHRKCPRASITAVAQVYRVAKAVWSGPL
jgi:hypothetical protein